MEMHQLRYVVAVARSEREDLPEYRSLRSPKPE
jgi:hypothetical protein